MATAIRSFHYHEPRKGETFAESTTARVNARKLKRYIWLRTHVEEMLGAGLCVLGLMWAAQSMSTMLSFDQPWLPAKALEALVGGIGLYVHATYRKSSRQV
jgi:hypothetical protein